MGAPAAETAAEDWGISFIGDNNQEWISMDSMASSWFHLMSLHFTAETNRKRLLQSLAR